MHAYCLFIYCCSFILCNNFIAAIIILFTPDNLYWPKSIDNFAHVLYSDTAKVPNLELGCICLVTVFAFRAAQCMLLAPLYYYRPLSSYSMQENSTRSDQQTAMLTHATLNSDYPLYTVMNNHIKLTFNMGLHYTTH